MEKLDLTTPNITDENVQKIAALFPNCVTEGDNGKTQVVDFDALKQELSSNIVEGNKERYQLTWPGKAESLATAIAPINETLRPNREESKDFDNTENLYIEGNNLEVLKLLQETYFGKVKMIYIDPPYNTGKDFVYKDNFKQGKAEYDEESGNVDEEGGRLVSNPDSNGRYHSDWLSMMYPRLKLARNLLKDDGVIFISIDDNEVHNLRKIGDEIFGERNLVSQIPWQARQSIQNDIDISSSHEYIVCYAKNRRETNRRLKESNKETWYKEKSFACYPLPLDKTKFNNPDNDSRGLWKADPFDAPNIRINLTYPITNPKTNETYMPPEGRCWRTSEQEYNKLLVDNRIVFGKRGVSSPQLKVFYDEKKEFGSTSNTWFNGDAYGTATRGTKLLQKLFTKSIFDTPKPIELIIKLMLLSVKNSDIILDFFSGSCSTAHAVMQLNAEDGGNRKFVMVQIPEATDEKSEAHKAGYKNIAEIGKERIRRAGEKIKADNADKEGIDDLDIGFRVLKVDSSNMKDVYFSPEKTIQEDIFESASNIKDDRTDEDLLFMVLLDWGIDLSVKIERREVAGKTVYFADDNFLAACFEENIDESFVKELVEEKPLKVVLRDNGFASDSIKVNIEQIFKQANIEVKVI